MSDEVDFRTVIIDIKRLAGMSNERIAGFVGMSRSGINRICNDGVMPRYDVGVRLLNLKSRCEIAAQYQP